jgi:RTA1 like protein
MSTEIIGYAARVAMHSNPFLKSYFSMYLVTIVIAPAFLSAAIYLCWARIVVVYGEERSRFRPRVFLAGDFLALLLQASGGGIASSANSKSTVSIAFKNRVILRLLNYRRNWASISFWQASRVKSLLSFSSHSAALSLPFASTPIRIVEGILTATTEKAQIDQIPLPPSAMGMCISRHSNLSGAVEQFSQ